MDFIKLIMNQQYDSVLSVLNGDASLDIQSVGVGIAKEQGMDLLKKQYEYLNGEVREVKVFKVFEDDRHLVTEYDILLKNSFDLPLVVILAKDGDKYSSLRTYHSVYPITEGHVYRASIFDDEIELTEPTEVVKYFEGITIGSVADTMETLSFEDDVYFREPAGWRWNHKSQKGLQEHFEHFFADGGVPLKFHNYIFDKEQGSFAGEYTCDVWGSATFKAQAGVSIYDINSETGKIIGIRVYDNVDPNYK